MVKALQLARRITRNPRKYFDREFVHALTLQARRRARMERLYGAAYLMRSISSGRRRVAFFPVPIDTFMSAEIYLIWKVLRLCGARPVLPDGAAPDLAVAWHPSTTYDLPAEALERMRAHCRVINADCTDIRKSVVDRTFEDVFGYGLPVDPAQHCGPMLRKSERNGPHDATLLHGPLLAAQDGYVYQRLVTCETPKGIAEWRTVIVAGRVASVYINYRPAANRFQTLPSSSEYCAVDDAFSPHEQDGIAEFCRRMGLDFGALDVLRDRDGKLYICDCNNTPTGPSEKLSRADQFRVSAECAGAFRAAFLA